MEELTQARVRELFEYREDGTLLWKVTNSNRAKAGSVAGSTRADRYVKVRIDGKPHYAHRIVYLWHFGEIPVLIDHIDGDPSNNRVDNLRPADFHKNQGNRKLGRSRSSKGVDWKPILNKWQARITINGRFVFLGLFATEEDAHAAYIDAACKHFGEFARSA